MDFWSRSKSNLYMCLIRTHQTLNQSNEILHLRGKEEELEHPDYIHQNIRTEISELDMNLHFPFSYRPQNKKEKRKKEKKRKKKMAQKLEIISGFLGKV